MPEDKKPYGVKRQWHLLPLREVAEAENSDLLRHLANFQETPSREVLLPLYFDITSRLKSTYGGNAHLDLLTQVLEHGATKYKPGNWKNANPTRYRQEYLSACCRHLFPADGNAIDPESGLPHLAHACCNVIMLMWMEKNITRPGEFQFEDTEI